MNGNKVTQFPQQGQTPVEGMNTQTQPMMGVPVQAPPPTPEQIEAMRAAQLEQLKAQHAFTAESVKILFDALVAVGFTDEQAIHLLRV
jgi:hypothetical protein